MKILRKTIIWFITLLYLGLVTGFVSNRYESLLCNSISINIRDSLNTGFLIPDDINELLNNSGISCLGIPLSEIDLNEIEQIVRSNQAVKECKVYSGINGVLHIDIDQREPFVRIIDRKGQGYYLDRDGNVLSLSNRFTPHVLIVNGNIYSPFTVGRPVNVKELADGRWQNRLKDIYKLSTFISQNELWEAHIEQVYINQSGEYELIPRIGPHIIILGEIEGYRDKFEKLEVFYKEGLNRIGWNQFIKINLKYKDQVVCTKI
jgi:cell division protein FtsQ